MNRKHILLAVAALGIGIALFFLVNTSPEKERLEKLQTLVELICPESAYEGFFSPETLAELKKQIGDVMLKQNANVEADKVKAMTDDVDALPKNITEQARRLMREDLEPSLDTGEIEELIDFYSTPTGKKYIDLTAHVMVSTEHNINYLFNQEVGALQQRHLAVQFPEEAPSQTTPSPAE